MSSAADRLREWLHEDFGVEIDALERVPHGVDFAAEVWRADSTDGRTYAVKWSGGGTPAGLLVPALLVQNEVEGIPAPLTARDGRPWTEREGRRLSVVPWVSDTGALDGAMTEAHWRSYGRLLARTHATAPTNEVLAWLPVEDYDPRAWVDQTAEVDRQLAAGGQADPLIATLADEWRAHSDAIGTIVEHAVKLAEATDRSAPHVICHADPHLGNVLVTDQQAWLIDWDDAVLAPRERDLMFVLSGGVLVFAPTTDREREWFFDGYGDVAIDLAIDLAIVTYYKCVRTLEDVVDPAAQVLDVEGETVDDRKTALDIARDQLSPGALADQALAGLRELGCIKP